MRICTSASSTRLADLRANVGAAAGGGGGGGGGRGSANVARAMREGASANTAVAIPAVNRQEFFARIQGSSSACAGVRHQAPPATQQLLVATPCVAAAGAGETSVVRVLALKPTPTAAFKGTGSARCNMP